MGEWDPQAWHGMGVLRRGGGSGDLLIGHQLFRHVVTGASPLSSGDLPNASGHCLGAPSGDRYAPTLCFQQICCFIWADTGIALWADTESEVHACNGIPDRKAELKCLLCSSRLGVILSN